VMDVNVSVKVTLNYDERLHFRQRETRHGPRGGMPIGAKVRAVVYPGGPPGTLVTLECGHRQVLRWNIQPATPESKPGTLCYTCTAKNRLSMGLGPDW
jgi:hypothetical protein